MATDRAEDMPDEFDFIVCGGGTAGPAVAARLAEAENVTVLLLEAGPDSANLENTMMVGGWSENFDTDLDWNLLSEPSPAADNRVMKLSRGKFLGGSSGLNGTLIVRGPRQDYDDWEAAGNTGWGSKDMWKYFKKSETFHPSPSFAADASQHGARGPIHTSPHPLAPISARVLESFEGAGFPRDDDMFARGTRAHGCGGATRSVWEGLRSTGGDYVKTRRGGWKKRKNLELGFGWRVDRVVINGEMVATGVQATHEKTGEVRTFRCRREVILSAGAYGSPQILQLSGIGAKEELFEAGIQPLVELPGVGKNLEDHLTVFVFYECTPGLTTDHLFHGPGKWNAARDEWRQNRTGTLSRSHFGAFAFARLDDRLARHPLWRTASTTSHARTPGRDPMGLTRAQPHAEFFSTERYAAPKHYTTPPPPGRSAFAMIVALFAQRSRGYVRLRSADPADKPVIQHNFLADPLDALVLAEACALGTEIVLQGKGTKDKVLGAWPPEEQHTKFTRIEQWEEFVRKNATTCFHPGGTCKMGPESDSGAVVDPRLRVKGVRGLRVADCSIMPRLNNGHTQAVAWAIGEKCADLVKEDWGDMGLGLEVTSRL